MLDVMLAVVLTLDWLHHTGLCHGMEVSIGLDIPMFSTLIG